MGFNTFGPLLVLDTQLTPAAGVVGTAVDATTEAAVVVYTMGGVVTSLVTNARGYVGQFQAPDTSVMLRVTFGDLAMDVVAKEAVIGGVGPAGAAGYIASRAVLDTEATAVDADPASALRVQQGARLSSTFRTITSVKSFGIVGDGVTDNTTAIDDAVAAGVPLFWPEGAYLYDGKITLSGDPGATWIGAGSRLSILKFTNPDTTACIERINGAASNWHLEGLLIDGTSSAYGTSRHGIFSEVEVGTPGGLNQSYGLRFVDVGVVNVSGDASHVTDWFQQYYQGCFARHVGGDGFVIAGDQFPTFINSGSFNLDIAGASWWIQNGKPFLQGLNCADVGIGLKLGRPPTGHARGPAYCQASLYGLNVEPIRAGGTGIYVDEGSSIPILVGPTLYSPLGVTPVAYGIRFKYLNDPCTFLDNPAFVKYSGDHAEFTNELYVDGASAAGSLMFNGGVPTASLNAAALLKAASFTVNNGAAQSSALTVGTFELSGAHSVITKTVVANLEIRRDSGLKDHHVLFVDATAGSIQISLDYPSYLPGRIIRVKRIDATGNTVTVVTEAGSGIDGLSSIPIASGVSKTFANNTSAWYTI